MDQKEQWANEVLHSLEGIEKASPKDDLFAKITAQISKEKVAKVIPLHQVRWVAVAACFVIGINLYVFSSGMQMRKNTVEENSSTYRIVSDYSLYN